MLRNLSTELFRHERIRTTLMKAKELRPFAEKLITLSKRETLHARRLVLRDIHDKDVVSKMFDTISSRFAQRAGGTPGSSSCGPRRGDNAEMALIELDRRGDREEGGRIRLPGAAPTPEAAGKKEAKPKARRKPEAREEGAGRIARADDAASKKASRSKGAAKPRTESKGKSKSGAATRKVGKSGS